MGHTAYVYPERSRIALIITSSSYPRILPHPNTMAPTWQETSPRVARNQVYHSPRYPSCLELPVLGL
jgi:predicted acyl esterase